MSDPAPAASPRHDQRITGGPPTRKWAALGGTTQSHTKPLAAASLFLIALPGDGKTFLLESNPQAFIFNLDKTSSPNPNKQAQSWPAIDPASGRPLGDDGRPIILTADLIEDKIKTLVRLAATNAPRPATVVFDSIAAWERILVSWLPANAAIAGVAQSAKTSWNELHGPAAYDWVRRKIVDTIDLLENHGYGVHVAGHFDNEWIPIGENVNKFTPVLSLSPKFWRRLYPMFEVVAVLSKSRAGKTQTPSGEWVQGYTWKLAVERTDFEGVLKTRVKFGPIEIPSHNSWAYLESEYEKARLSLVGKAT